MKPSIYTALPLKVKLTNKIMVYYQTIWIEKRFNASTHKQWLLNFQEDEKIDSLYLLSKFMFFGSQEIRELLISIFRDKFKYDIVERYRESNSDTVELANINAHFEEQLSCTRFVSLGCASESGAHILMLFRQYNKLSTKYMKSSSDIISEGKLKENHVKHYIFIDDFCGSGETAINCNPLIESLKKLDPNIKVSYFVLFATGEGFENLKNHGRFDRFDAAFILDITFKCFNDSSRYFLEPYPELNKKAAMAFCTKYGHPLVAGTPVAGHPLGFANGQLLMSFAHNTPDNTLPIFWSDKNWTPIFVRYIKTKS